MGIGLQATVTVVFCVHFIVSGYLVVINGYEVSEPAGSEVEMPVPNGEGVQWMLMPDGQGNVQVAVLSGLEPRTSHGVDTIDFYLYTRSTQPGTADGTAVFHHYIRHQAERGAGRVAHDERVLPASVQVLQGPEEDQSAGARLRRQRPRLVHVPAAQGRVSDAVRLQRDSGRLGHDGEHAMVRDGGAQHGAGRPPPGPFDRPPAPLRRRRPRRHPLNRLQPGGPRGRYGRQEREERHHQEDHRAGPGAARIQEREARGDAAADGRGGGGSGAHVRRLPRLPEAARPPRLLPQRRLLAAARMYARLRSGVQPPKGVLLPRGGDQERQGVQGNAVRFVERLPGRQVQGGRLGRHTARQRLSDQQVSRKLLSGNQPIQTIRCSRNTQKAGIYRRLE